MLNEEVCQSLWSAHIATFWEHAPQGDLHPGPSGASRDRLEDDGDGDDEDDASGPPYRLQARS